MIKYFRSLAYRFLRKSERYTGTDNVYLAKGGLWLSTASSFASASSFILALLFARLVPKAAYGAYQYALAWGAILSISALSGMGGALIRAVAQGKSGTILGLVRMRMRWSLIGIAVAVAGGGYYAIKGRLDLAAAVVILGLTLPLQSSLYSWVDYLIGKKRFDLQVRYSALETLTAAGALIAAMFLLPTAPALAAAYGLAHLGMTVYAYRSVLKRLPPEGGVDPDAVAYGKQLSLIDLFGTIAAYVDRIVVFTFLGAAETAVYVFATAPPEQLKGYLKSVYFIAFPKIAERRLDEMKRGFFRKCLLMIGATAAIAGAYALAAPFLYPILFPAYHESIPLTRLFILSLPAAASVLPMALFAGHRLIRENAIAQIGSSTVSIVLLFILTKKYGLPGAVCARVIGRYSGLVLSMGLAASVFRRAALESQTPSEQKTPA